MLSVSLRSLSLLYDFAECTDDNDSIFCVCVCVCVYLLVLFAKDGAVERMQCIC